MKDENKEEVHKKKFLSRKFVVWLMATAIMIFSLIITLKSDDSNIAMSFIPWWGSISVVYIGGNVAQDFAFSKKKVE